MPTPPTPSAGRCPNRTTPRPTTGPPRPGDAWCSSAALDCGHAQFYPRPLCIRCAGDVEWEEASGEGTVHTFTVIRQNLAPPFGELGAYVVAMIDLAEGPRMMSNVTHVEPDEVRVGMGVTVYAVKVRDDMGLPFWRPSNVEGTSSE